MIEYIKHHLVDTAVWVFAVSFLLVLILFLRKKEIDIE